MSSARDISVKTNQSWNWNNAQCTYNSLPYKDSPTPKLAAKRSAYYSISIYFRSLIAYKVRVDLDYCWKYKPMRELCVGAYLVARVEGPYKTPAVIDNGRPG
ncbi:hypothetical protein ACN38_g10172 [Penicillium nordicum]|uniref:Uncharacterized protein n=1 Tax=Penicillium nordicum TaxID=229535 RepID=A0A0M8NWX2_9EURO|nr:hypothetical protein ACN38_g10172 [Penicillium nordicum]